MKLTSLTKLLMPVLCLAVAAGCQNHQLPTTKTRFQPNTTFRPRPRPIPAEQVSEPTPLAVPPPGGTATLPPGELAGGRKVGDESPAGSADPRVNANQLLPPLGTGNPVTDAIPPGEPKFDPTKSNLDQIHPLNDQDLHANWIPDQGVLQAQTVYFDFDKSSIKGSEQSKLEAVAAYLKQHPAAALQVAGNCDSRGTEEYNRSLGERRALAAREVLIRLDIDANRIETISFGADKPADSGQNDAAWAHNRRDEFIILTAPKP